MRVQYASCSVLLAVTLFLGLCVGQDTTAADPDAEDYADFMNFLNSTDQQRQMQLERAESDPGAQERMDDLLCEFLSYISQLDSVTASDALQYLQLYRAQLHNRNSPCLDQAEKQLQELIGQQPVTETS